MRSHFRRARVIRGWAILSLLSLAFHSVSTAAAPPNEPRANVQPASAASAAQQQPCPTSNAGFSMMVARVEAIYEARAQGDFLAEAPRMVACFAELEEPLSRDVAPHYLRARAYSWFPSRDFAKVEAALRAVHDLEPDARVPSAIAPKAGHPMYDAQARAVTASGPRPQPVTLPAIPSMSYRVNGVPTATVMPDVLNVVQIVSPAIGVFYNQEMYPGEPFSLDDVPGLDLARRQVAQQIQRSNRLMLGGGGALVLAGGAFTYARLQARALEADPGLSVAEVYDRQYAGQVAATVLGTAGLTLLGVGVCVRW